MPVCVLMTLPSDPGCVSWHRFGADDELLNETLFSSLDHARELLAAWQDDYNTVRPHSGIGNQPPCTYARLTASTVQRDGMLRYVEGSAPRPVASPSHNGSNDQRILPIAG